MMLTFLHNMHSLPNYRSLDLATHRKLCTVRTYVYVHTFTYSLEGREGKTGTYVRTYVRIHFVNFEVVGFLHERVVGFFGIRTNRSLTSGGSLILLLIRAWQSIIASLAMALLQFLFSCALSLPTIQARISLP